MFVRVHVRVRVRVRAGGRAGALVAACLIDLAFGRVLLVLFRLCLFLCLSFLERGTAWILVAYVLE